LPKTHAKTSGDRSAEKTRFRRAARRLFKILPSSLSDLRASLLAWYDTAKRPLPWRTEPSLYRTIVSELMCQQTQIATVLPYFARWMTAFPDFAALAAASEAEVLKHWEGLGYYRRARLLHALAQAVVARDELPADAAGWQKLPGIGPYTAAAIASIHLDEPVPVIDGNVIRVLARLDADATPFKGSQQAQKHLGPRAGELLDATRPGDWNQAMMELGATICVKAKPLCLLCPLKAHCQSGPTGTAEQYPVLVRAQTKSVTVPRLWLEDATGRLLLAQRPADARRLPNVWELPEADGLADLADAQPWVTKKRGISQERITEPIYRFALDESLQEKIQTHPNLRWTTVKDRAALTLSGPHRRWINELTQEDV